MSFLSRCGIKENKVLRDFVWWGTIIALLLLNVLCLVGCTSAAPGIPDLSLLTVHGPEPSSVEHVDVGLYGLCIRTAHSLDCRPTAGSDIGALADSFHPPPNGTISPQLRRLLETALRLQSRVLVSPLPGAGVSFALSLICWYLTRRVEPGVNQKRGLPRWVNCAFWTCCGASLALSLGSALCATVVVGAAVFVSDLAPASSPVLIAADTRHVIALQWVLVCLVLFFMLLAKDKCGKCEAKAAGEEGPILPTKEPESSSSSEEGVAGALQVHALGKYEARFQARGTMPDNDGAFRSFNKGHIAGGSGVVFIAPGSQQQPMIMAGVSSVPEQGWVEGVVEQQPAAAAAAAEDPRLSRRPTDRQQQQQQTATDNPHITLPAPVQRRAPQQQPTAAENLRRSRSRVRSPDQAPAPAQPPVRSAQTQTQTHTQTHTQTQTQAETAPASASARRQPSSSRRAVTAAPAAPAATPATPAPAAVAVTVASSAPADTTEPTESVAADPLAQQGFPQLQAKPLTRSESVQPVRRTAADALPRSMSVSAAGRDRNVTFQREDNRRHSSTTRRESLYTVRDSWAESIE